jgi:hypothetical protein
MGRGAPYTGSSEQDIPGGGERTWLSRGSTGGRSARPARRSPSKNKARPDNAVGVSGPVALRPTGQRRWPVGVRTWVFGLTFAKTTRSY